MSPSSGEDLLSWSELELQEKLANKPTISTTRKLIGLGAFVAGSTVLSLNHRHSIASAGGKIAKVDTLSVVLLMISAGCMAPMAIPSSSVLYTNQSPTHAPTESNLDDNEFEFKILNNRWNKEVKRLENEMGKRPFWFPENIRKLLKDGELKEREKKREALIQKEKDLEEMIRKDLEENNLSPQEVLQKLTKRVYIIDFHDYDFAIPRSDQIASHKKENPENTTDWVAFFRDSVSLLMKVATPFDEIVIRISSPGGSVSEYGLAASHLLRLRRAGLKTTVCVDTVAASGGYMMACCADKVVASDFAILGSVGVVAELPNFHRVLDKYDVDYLLFTAGEFKRTVHHLAENTEEGTEKFQEQLEEIHESFKNHVSSNRPVVDSKSFTGEAWLAGQAKSKGLVDVLMTTEEYLDQLEQDGFDLVHVRFKKNKSKTGVLSSLMWDMLEMETYQNYYRQLTDRVQSFKSKLPFNPQRLLAKL